MFKIIAPAAAILAASAVAATAGGVAPPPPAPVVVVPPVIEDPFDGFYVGVEYGHAMGELTELLGSQTFANGDLDLDNGTAYGVFAGYNVQNGSLVYGGEIRFLHFNDFQSSIFPVVELESTIDLRARVGFAAGSAVLVYGALGYSMVDGTVPSGSVDLDGINYGAGVEYNVTESIFVGADYTGRMVEGSAGGFDYEGDVNTATLRLGFRF